MAIFYPQQSEIQALSVKNGIASYRLSDQRQVLFGGRGSKYDELVYLRAQNTDDATVNTKSSDAWARFAGARGVTSVSRNQEKRRLFFQEGSFP